MKTDLITELAIETSDIKNAVLLLRALNNSLRQQILKFIHLNNRVTVTEVHIEFRIEQSVASDHLGILREARLVVNERKGRFIFYSVNYKELQRFHLLFAGFLEE